MLHVYSNDFDWVVAESEEDAVKVWEETMGDIYDESNGEFVLESDDDLFTLSGPQLRNPLPLPEGAEVIENLEDFISVRAKFGAFAKAYGRCFLGSTEY